MQGGDKQTSPGPTFFFFPNDPTGIEFSLSKGDNENTTEFTNQQKQKAEDRRLMLAF
jgi:hypothetical protein